MGVNSANRSLRAERGVDGLELSADRESKAGLGEVDAVAYKMQNQRHAATNTWVIPQRLGLQQSVADFKCKTVYLRLILSWP